MQPSYDLHAVGPESQLGASHSHGTYTGSALVVEVLCGAGAWRNGPANRAQYRPTISPSAQKLIQSGMSPAGLQANTVLRSQLPDFCAELFKRLFPLPATVKALWDDGCRCGHQSSARLAPAKQHCREPYGPPETTERGSATVLLSWCHRQRMDAEKK